MALELMTLDCYDNPMSKMLLGVLLSLASCSYTFKRQDLNLGTAQQPAGTQRLFIPLVDNVTNRTGIESIVTNSLREKFSSQKNIEVVNSEDDGNFKLLVTLTEYSTRFGTDPRRGNPGSAQAGGIGDRQTMAGNIILKLITNCLIYQSYFEETARFVGIDKDGNTRGAYKMARK
jgi:hypothetical protein